MAEKSFQERTEKATPKRRKDSRRKGRVAQSREIPSVLILITSLGVFFFAGSSMFQMLTRFTGSMFQQITLSPLQDIGSTAVFFTDLFMFYARVTLPLMLAILAAGVSAHIAQFGVLFTTETLTPKLSRLSPINGFKRIFSLRSLVELTKSVLKVLAIGVTAYFLIRGELRVLPELVHSSVLDILAYTARVAFKISLGACVTLIVLAALDYAYQRWEYEKNLRMTKQEVKDEFKQTEGDPKVKARIRSIQMDVARKRMMEAVPEADVVITNPTHLAVALRFDAGQMTAPCVVAKGSGHVAERIRQIASQHHVPMVENKPLARTLYSSVDIGESIPVELYKAVAQILAYVYRLKGYQPAM